MTHRARFPALLVIAALAAAAAHAAPASNGPGCTQVCSRALADTFPDVKDWSSLVITLTRSACDGDCPDYSVEIHGDGTVVFNGHHHVAQTGTYRARVSRDAVRALVAKFRAADYFSLPAAYRARSKELVTYTTSLAFDGRYKQVVDYGGVIVGMPYAVDVLERSIDETADTNRWIKAPDAPPE